MFTFEGGGKSVVSQYSDSSSDNDEYLPGQMYKPSSLQNPIREFTMGGTLSKTTSDFNKRTGGVASHQNASKSFTHHQKRGKENHDSQEIRIGTLENII